MDKTGISSFIFSQGSQNVYRSRNVFKRYCIASYPKIHSYTLIYDIYNNHVYIHMYMHMYTNEIKDNIINVLHSRLIEFWYLRHKNSAYHHHLSKHCWGRSPCQGTPPSPFYVGDGSFFWLMARAMKGGSIVVFI